MYNWHIADVDPYRAFAEKMRDWYLSHGATEEQTEFMILRRLQEAFDIPYEHAEQVVQSVMPQVFAKIATPEIEIRGPESFYYDERGQQRGGYDYIYNAY